MCLGIKGRGVMEEMRGQRFSRFFVWGSVFLYSLLFPIVFWCSLMSFMLVGNGPSASGWVGVVLCVSIPVLMLVTVRVLLSFCLKQQYRRALWYVLSPLLYCASVLVLFGWLGQRLS